MRGRQLPRSSTDPRRTPGGLWAANRQDSTNAPAMVASSISRIKKKIFSAPSKCPIGLFGPVANGTILERLHVSHFVLLASVLQYASFPALGQLFLERCVALTLR